MRRRNIHLLNCYLIGNWTCALSGVNWISIRSVIERERGRISRVGAPRQRRDLKSTKSRRKKRRAKESPAAVIQSALSAAGTTCACCLHRGRDKKFDDSATLAGARAEKKKINSASAKKRTHTYTPKQRASLYTTERDYIPLMPPASCRPSVRPLAPKPKPSI